MVVSQSTTQVDPLVVGATEVFAALNIQLLDEEGVAADWDLTGGSFSFTLTGPGNPPIVTVLDCAISTNNATAPRWTVNTPGRWEIGGIGTDSTGFAQPLKPLPFLVAHA
jgi:hypothetical protein